MNQPGGTSSVLMGILRGLLLACLVLLCKWGLAQGVIRTVQALVPSTRGTPSTPAIEGKLGPRPLQSRTISAESQPRRGWVQDPVPHNGKVRYVPLAPYAGPPCNHGEVSCAEVEYSPQPWEVRDLLPNADRSDSAGTVGMHSKRLKPHDVIEVLAAPRDLSAGGQLRTLWTFPDGSEEVNIAKKEVGHRTSFIVKRTPGPAGWAVGGYRVVIDATGSSAAWMRFEVVPDTP